MSLRITARGALAAALLAGLAVTAAWRWGIQPARGLSLSELTQLHLATNRIHQSLWETGYRPEDCTSIKSYDPAYTCVLTGPALDRVRAALNQPAGSYYLLRQDPVPDPVHILSFGAAEGGYYLLAVKSLAEADAGIFYGYRAKGESILTSEIRWFRYTNPDLGRVLRELRGKR